MTTNQPERRRRVGLLLGVAVLVIAADVISKVMVVARIPEHTYVHLIGSLLMLTLTRNGGAAFNLGGTSMTIVFTAIAAGVVTYILRAARNLRSIGWAIALGLLLGGATGNLIDRIFRAPGPFRGDVVDWIELPHWPVFNVADSSIVCAGVLVVLLALRGIRLDGTRAVRDDDFNRADPHTADPHTADPHTAGPRAAGPQSASPYAAGLHAADPQSASPRAAGPETVDPPQSDTSEPDYTKPDYPEPQSRAAQSP